MTTRTRGTAKHDADGYLARVVAVTGHSAPFLAIAAAVLGFGSLFSAKLNHPAVIGGVAAVSSAVWWADFVLRERLVKSRARRQEEFERTPPSLEFLDAQIRDGKLVVAIKSTNLVPFACRWVLVTTANNIVSGIQMQDLEIYPQALFENTFVFSDVPDKKKIVDQYLELRFRYYSIFSAKFGGAKELGLRTLTVAWQINSGVLTRVEPRVGVAKP